MDLEKLREELLADVRGGAAVNDVLKKLNGAYAEIKGLPVEKKASFGQKLNEMKQEIVRVGAAGEVSVSQLAEIDKTAPFLDANSRDFGLRWTDGSQHPITFEMERMRGIAERIGFNVIEGRQLDDDFHMFGALNFPEGHPARDSFDTFRTEEGFIPPAHTTAMQNRILLDQREKLLRGEQIATITLGRTFRNEDVDVTHEHTFYQWDGVFVSKTADLAQMIAIIREFFEAFYGEKLKIATQPACFPFTEPSMEFMIEKPASIGGKPGEWLEMLGCGMIHPNVLRMAKIDPEVYRGFAWGGGFDRLIMLKYGIDDIRYLESGKLAFLKEFR
ncbi:MAG: hypothetical protein LBM97_02475 [Candidatus Nomurabacteria bacterium]|jgi:phenylalanyl-tRNA synthetase alpha chain|nr:hypothetical protein [Candidatus Nomurabacteria bacterium]